MYEGCLRFCLCSQNLFHFSDIFITAFHSLRQSTNILCKAASSAVYLWHVVLYEPQHVLHGTAVAVCGENVGVAVEGDAACMQGVPLAPTWPARD